MCTILLIQKGVVNTYQKQSIIMHDLLEKSEY